MANLRQSKTDEEIKKLYDMLTVIEENVERNMPDYRE